MFEASGDPFPHLLLEVADVVGGKDGLHVGQKPLAARAEVQVVACEAHVEALVGKVVDVCPIVVVAAGAVHLVHDEAISFTFPSNTVIGAGDYLVVSRNAGRLMTNYANLTAGNTVGDFSGKLSGAGERLKLTMPDTIVVTNWSGVVETPSRDSLLPGSLSSSWLGSETRM